MDKINDLLYQAEIIAIAVAIMSFALMGLAAIGYALFIFWKYRDREHHSLQYVLLQVAVPRDNETKIDAAEQMFSAFSGIKGAKGLLGFSKVPDYIAFEIVAKPGDIRFYVSIPKKLEDMVEKQIHGAYPDASISPAEEYDIFTDQSKVAFAGLVLKSSPYIPIKSFQQLPVDPMSTMVSTLGKMQEGESAAIQILITPTDGKWKKQGRAHITGIKKREANPETAKYSVDQKELEAIEGKLSKPAFNTYIRLVVSSSSKEAANAHLDNMVTSFTQFSSYNSFSKEKMKHFKGMFMVDFIDLKKFIMGSVSGICN
jgi:hypothetical protein